MNLNFCDWCEKPNTGAVCVDSGKAFHVDCYLAWRDTEALLDATLNPPMPPLLEEGASQWRQQ